MRLIMRLKISCVVVITFYITDKPLNEVLKYHVYFKQNNHAGFCLFVCLLECSGGVFFPIFFFSDEADVDNEISREIDVMLENIQNSL